MKARSKGGGSSRVGASALQTRLRSAERRLRELERRFETVMDAVNESVYDWDIARDRIVYSARMEMSLGLPPAALQRPRDWWDRIHPDDLESYRTALVAHFKGETPRFECDFRFRSQDGSWRWARQHGLATRNRRGRAIRLLGSTGDITELKEHERQLAEKTAILETTLENMDQGITLVDEDLRTIALNRRFLELLDFPPERFARGFHMEDAFRFNAERGEYGPGDVEEMVRARTELSRRFEPLDFERTRPSGRVISVCGRPLPGGRGFVTTYTDVTEARQAAAGLRRSEERYALATSAAVEGIYEWDVAAGTLFLTERAKEFFAIAGDTLTPAAWNVRVHPDDYAGYKVAIANHFAGRAPILEHEYRIADAKGVYKWVLDRGVGVRDANGRVTKVVGALSDITQRKEAEIELRRARDEAERSLEQQVATSEILRVISQSRTDVQPVFDAIVRNAVRLCGADHSIAARFDGELLHPLAHHGFSPEAEEILARTFPMRPGPANMLGRTTLQRAVVNLPDMLADPDYSRDFALAGGWRSGLGVPLFLDGNLVGAIAVSRTEPGAFSDGHVELLKTFAEQAVIAIENVRLFTELEARNRDLTEALEQQTATSEILRAISRSPTDTQPVFDIIGERAEKLCGAEISLVSIVDGDRIRLTALHGENPAGSVTIRRHFPMPLSAQTVTARTVRSCAVVHVADVLADPGYEARDAALEGGFRGSLGVPMLRDGRVIGVIFVSRRTPGQFRDSQVELLRTFADQAVIAIENVRLFTELEARNRDLTEALEQQTATSEILKVISRSQTDVQPVFDTIASAVLKLCRADFANVFTYDGKLVHLVASVNVHQDYVEFIKDFYPRPPGRETGSTRAIQTGKVEVIPDVLADPDYAIAAPSASSGFRSILAVPLLRDGKAVGAIAVGRPEPGPFPATQIALLQTFADQAVIAIENVRLFTELEARNHDLTETLEQQTATGEILRAISQSPTDTQPVFDAIVRSASQLCDAHRTVLVRLSGDELELAAVYHAKPRTKLAATFPRRLGRDLAVGRAILDGTLVHIANVREDPDYSQDLAQALEVGSTLSVPLMRDGKPIGAIGVSRATSGAFPENRVKLLKTFADQAVIAIENVRLFTELDARTRELVRSVEELKALGEVGRAVSSTLDLETVLSTIVSRATELAGMDGGALFEYHEAEEAFRLHTADRLPDEIVAALGAAPIPKGEGAIGSLVLTGEPVQIRDIAAASGYQSRVREILIRRGFRSLLAVPLLREDRLLGGLVVTRKSAGEFAPHVIDLLRTFATQSALAIQNARLFREIEQKSRELEAASRHKSEFLANMSHELRTPLNAIIGFSEVLAERMFGEINEKQADYLNDILESGRHLLSLINDILDLSKIEAGRMELEPSEFALPDAIDNALILVRERANRHGIALACEIDDRLGTIRADERKVKQVLLNLLTNALKFTPEGGRVEVRACVHEGAAEISVTDTGVGIAPEDQAAVFEEFRQVGTASKKIEGTGLGLAISRKFIELHGGRIWVTSQPGAGSTFAFTLPLSATAHQGEPRAAQS